MPTPRELVSAFEGYVVDYAEHYLCPKGWFESIRTRESVDGSGPCPWITYPALKVLDRIVRPGYRVFEYGSGSSSIWWRGRVGELVSVEHDPSWSSRVTANPQPNHTLYTVPAGAPLKPEWVGLLEREFFGAGLDPAPGDDPERNLRSGLLSRAFAAYACRVLDYPPGHFDVIVIDGMARVLTAWLAARVLSPSGFILFDNSDRDAYQGGYDILSRAGFHRIDFWGTGPINPYEWCTSIFTRTLTVF
jgi:hypothetical protein